MQLIKATDYDDAPESWVAGVSSVSMLAPGVVEVTFYRDLERAYTEHGFEHRVVSRQIWWLQELENNLSVLLQALQDMRMIRSKPTVVPVAGMH